MTRAEPRALPREDHRAHVAALAQLAQRGDQLRHQPHRQRVALARAIHRQRGHRAVYGDLQKLRSARLHAHIMPRSMPRQGGWRRPLALAGALALLAPANALALAPCPGSPPATKTLLSGQGRLESVLVDPRGRLFFTNGTQLLRLDRPGAAPRVLVDGVDGPGGLVV